MKMSNSSYPLISIVIPSFNQGLFIEQTIVSILGQNYPNIELIVIDGGSTDNTPNIIDKYANSIAYCVSEPDNGQAEAINKGFRLATGDIFAWLNSDDLYLPCTLSKVAGIFTSNSQPQLIYGGCILFAEGGQFTQGRLPIDFDPERLTYFDYIEQPATFWSRRVWEMVGELNESYHYVLDWDWFIRASRMCRLTPFREYLALYRLHDAHKTGSGRKERIQEILRLVQAYAPPKWATAYREIARHMPLFKSRLNRLRGSSWFWLRFLYYPHLYLKYRRNRIDNNIFHML